MGKNLVRNVNIAFRVTEDERELIAERMKECGIRSVRGYLLKMALNGYIVNLDLSEIKELSRLMRIMGNNVNQLARHANTTGIACVTDVADIKEMLGTVWERLDKLIQQLSKI